MDQIDSIPPETESMSPPVKRQKTFSAKPIERVSLGKFESEKVEQWLMQINDSSKGFLTLAKSDILNFLIRQHRDELQQKELLAVRAYHYDPIKHITWITPQIKAALAGGDSIRVAELQAELRGVELSVISDAMTKRRDHVSSGALLPSETNKKLPRRRKQNPISESGFLSREDTDNQAPDRVE